MTIGTQYALPAYHAPYQEAMYVTSVSDSRPPAARRAGLAVAGPCLSQAREPRGGGPTPTRCWPCWRCLCRISGIWRPRSPCRRSLCGHGVGPVAMEEMEVAVLRCCQRPPPGEAGWPERASSGPLGTDFVDGRVGKSGFTLRVVRKGPRLPGHARIQAPHDGVKDPVLAPCALWAPLGHGAGRQEQCGALRCGEWDGHRRRDRLWCRGAHEAMASDEAW
jgi:hypothetical protein